MKLNKNLLINLLLSLGVTGLILFSFQKGFLKRLELSNLDFSFNLRGTRPSNPHIVIIEITDSDISSVGRWPWKRTWHATILRALKRLGAKEIFFDIVFSEPSAEEEDALFSESIKESRLTYLPFVFPQQPCRIKEAILPLARFSPFLKGMGSINIYPDPDGTVRSIPLVFPEENGISQHISLKLAADYLGMEIKEIRPNTIILGNSQETMPIPLWAKNTMLINWAGKWQHTFKHYSFLEVLAAYKDYLENKPTALNLSDFKDSVCLIGVTAIGLYDIKPVPVQAEYPAIGVTANAINNILNRDFLFFPPGFVIVIICLILSLVPAFLIKGEKPILESLFVLLIAGAYFLLHIILFKNNFLLDLTIPLSGFFASSLVIETYNFIRVAVERKKFFTMSVTDGLTGLYNIRYFKLLLETEIKLLRVDSSRKFCIIMSDVDHFKHFNDTYGHQVGDLVLKEVSRIIKTSVRAYDIVARYGGEEMIVLLRGSELKDGLAIAEKIRKNMEAYQLKDEKNTYKVTISLGISIYRKGDTVDEIIKRADDGLYKAKESGRNRVYTIEEAPAA